VGSSECLPACVVCRSWGVVVNGSGAGRDPECWLRPGVLWLSGGERFQRCLSGVRTALAMTVMRLGLRRVLRKIRQDFRRATPRSAGPGPRTGPVDGPLGGGGVRRWAGGASQGDPVSGSDAGHVREEWDALALTDSDD
jgi:hypothetical protein